MTEHGHLLQLPIFTVGLRDHVLSWENPLGRPSFFGITMLQFRMIDTPTIRAAPFWKTPLNNFHNTSLMAEIWKLEHIFA